MKKPLLLECKTPNLREQFHIISGNNLQCFSVSGYNISFIITIVSLKIAVFLVNELGIPIENYQALYLMQNW